MREHVHIQGRLITGLYSNNVGYVLAQVVSLVFRKQSARSKLLEYEYTPEPFVDKILYCTKGIDPIHDFHYNETLIIVMGN